MRTVAARPRRVKAISARTPRCRICGFIPEPSLLGGIEDRQQVIFHVRRSHPTEYRGFPFESEVVLAQSDGVDLHSKLQGSARKAGR